MTNATKTTIDYEASLADWWDRLGVPILYPATWEQVRALLEVMDYQLPDNGLEYLAATGLLTPPGDDQWEASDIVFLVSACETMRWYREEPDSIHWMKLSRWQRGRCLAQHNGTFDQLAEGMTKFSVRHLCLLMMQAKTIPQRDQAWASLETKLISEEIE